MPFRRSQRALTRSGLAVLALGLVTGCTRNEAPEEFRPSFAEAYVTGEGELPPLVQAAGKGDLVQLRKQLETDLVDKTNGSGYTALHLAARNGQVEAVQVLLRRSANPNAPSGPTQTTPLHLAAMNGHVEIVRLLLKHHANPTAKARDGSTPIDFARVKGHAEVIKLLERR